MNEMNNRYKIFSPEDAEENIDYSFTLNIDPDLIRKYNNLTNQYYQYLNKLKHLKYCNYDVTFEISKLGKLHLHGKIKINNIQKFYFYDVKKLMESFSFEIDTIDNVEKWDEYINKNYSSIKELFKEYNLKPNINDVYVRTVMVNIK